jgi:hypothetical protein
LFSATARCTTPGPVPLDGSAVIQLARASTAQRQLGAAAIVMSTSPLPSPTDAWLGDAWTSHARWRIVNACDAIVTAPLLAAEPSYGATTIPTESGWTSSVIQAADDEAVHPQPAGAVTFAAPLPPAAEKSAAESVTANVQLGNAGVRAAERSHATARIAPIAAHPVATMGRDRIGRGSYSQANTPAIVLPAEKEKGRNP